VFNLAGWQSGYAAACKAVYAGSIPASASKIARIKLSLQYARVVELVDTRDLKSLASNGVPVQVRLRVPFFLFKRQHI
jgi:hypothetical protein